MKTPFKKGQKVYWGELKGEVVEINLTCDYPLTVKFNDVPYLFTKDGRYDENLPPVLSITPYTLNGFSQEPQIEKDTLVYVRDSELDDWKMAFYSQFEDGTHYCYPYQKKSTETDKVQSWKFLETENPLLK